MVYIISYPWGLLSLLFLSHVNLYSFEVTLEDNILNKLNNETLLSQNETVDVVETRHGGTLNSNTEETSCNSCSKTKSKLSNEDEKSLRIEIIKKQILQKLKLAAPLDTEKPSESAVKALIEAAKMNKNFHEEEEEKDVVENIILRPTNDTISCTMSYNISCTKFRYRLPKYSPISHRDSATLLLYKKDVSNILQLSHVVTDSVGDEIFNIISPIPIQESANNPRMVKIMVPPPSTWVSVDGSAEFDVQIICIGCSTESATSVSEMEDEVPLLVVSTIQRQLSRKQRSSLNCTATTTSCCRQHLYINFTDLGWDNWIIHPDGFHAYYCMGSCYYNMNALTDYHGHIMHLFISRSEDEAEKMGLQLCCTAAEMSSLQIIHQQPDGSTKDITLKDLIVKTCKCA